MKRKTEITLWARRKDAEEWQEEIITSTTDPEHLKAARQWAEKQGFVHLREIVFDGRAPNFAATVK